MDDLKKQDVDPPSCGGSGSGVRQGIEPLA